MSLWQNPDTFRPHTLAPDDTLAAAASTPGGLEPAEAERRLEIAGPNRLPAPPRVTIWQILAHQFASPLIYLLIAAAGVAFALGEHVEAVFIAIVLALNAIIGTIQEYGAEKSAEALANLVPNTCHVVRLGREHVVDATTLVPGDVVIVEAGVRVPADIRLLQGLGIQVDESLLTGESLAVQKDADAPVPEDSVVADRGNMLFAGTMVTRGRARGVVTHTGGHTALGRLAVSLGSAKQVRPPLLVRMERFSRSIALIIGIVAVFVALLGFSRGMPAEDIFLICVALAVGAIPEGLPVALTVALSIATRRMGKRNVIARRLVAVEALGSCTFIASDKTGTLTRNELAVERVLLPGVDGGFREVSVHGAHAPQPFTALGDGGTQVPFDADDVGLSRLVNTGLYCNDAQLQLDARNEVAGAAGDAVDIALLLLAARARVDWEEERGRSIEVGAVPFDPDLRFSASIRRNLGNSFEVHLKGAPERILAMCRFGADEAENLRAREALLTEVDLLAARGYRVLAFASGAYDGDPRHPAAQSFNHLDFIGFVGMIDPLREEAVDAVAACGRAGITVAMVTGDHPVTALAIARQLGMAESKAQVVTGAMLSDAAQRGPDALRACIADARVFARVEPAQKLLIVENLQKIGHFVAVTGDGANDAPALRAGHVGVAMGKRGTDIAREASSLILTDDNFASIVAGIEEGRVAYTNVRKVTFLLIATGMTEVVFFLATMALGLPLPLLPVQLLWLNLVTNGIQDVALAFEPAEGHELSDPPRAPNERIFDGLMIQRVAIAAIWMGTISTIAFKWLIENNYSEFEARNVILLGFVLFENVAVGSARSETVPVLKMSPFRNPVLLVGTLAALGLHILAMVTPGISDVLQVAPVAVEYWLLAGAIALSSLIVLELHKWIRGKLTGARMRVAPVSR